MSEKPHKDGLSSAIDFTKYTLTISGAAILFLLGSDTLKTVVTPLAKILVTAALLSFGASAVGGVLVLMAGATNMSDGDYDLGAKWLRAPGLGNVFGLIAGFAFLTAFVILRVWLNEADISK